MNNLKYIKRMNEDLIIEGSEIELGKEKENQNNINNDISLMRDNIAKIEKSNKNYLEKTTQKSKIMKDIANRTIDLGRSLQLEADLMIKVAKENPNPEKKMGASGEVPAAAPSAPTPPTV